MSAAEQQIFESDDIVLGGSPVPPVVLPGQIDPHAWHYFYSAGERELKTRARDVGYSSIPPGFLVPLRPFKIKDPNDTVESLFEENAPKEKETTVEPRDQADALMTRYQHRGGRILFPLIGMEGASGLARAKKIFAAIHPSIHCKHNAEGFKRMAAAKPVTCVACRLADLRSVKSVERIERAKLSDTEDIKYGLNDDGSLRVISEQEAATIIHAFMLSANEELYVHMVDVLQVSNADVDAGRMGPGKKKFDKRDEWYFLNTHFTPEQLKTMSSEPQRGTQGVDLASLVSETIRATKQDGQSGPIDVTALLAKQEAKLEAKHKAELEAMEKRILASFEKAAKKNNKPE